MYTKRSINYNIIYYYKFAILKVQIKIQNINYVSIKILLIQNSTIKCTQ